MWLAGGGRCWRKGRIRNEWGRRGGAPVSAIFCFWGKAKAAGLFLSLALFLCSVSLQCPRKRADSLPPQRAWFTRNTVVENSSQGPPAYWGSLVWTKREKWEKGSAGTNEMSVSRAEMRPKMSLHFLTTNNFSSVRGVDAAFGSRFMSSCVVVFGGRVQPATSEHETNLWVWECTRAERGIARHFLAGSAASFLPSRSNTRKHQSSSPPESLDRPPTR